MVYKDIRNYENCNKKLFPGDGVYGIPDICPTQYEECKWIPFNYAAKYKENRNNTGIHFFIDDYQFQRLWIAPDNYIKMLQQYKYVMAPDFSLYNNFPRAVQIFNHYKKHWIAAYLQEHGVKVIPSICWSDRDSFEWCFDGEPTHSTVAISSVGTLNSREKTDRFYRGYCQMLMRLKPEKVLFHGEIPKFCDESCITPMQTIHHRPWEMTYNGK